jgi:hypothetical protein
MSIEGGEDEDEDEKVAAAVVSPVMSTPQPREKRQATASAGAAGGAHVSIVTPDGQPLPLPATPIVARRLDLKRGAEDNAEAVDSDMEEAAGGIEQLRSTPSSTQSLPTMDELKVNSAAASSDAGDMTMKEGDQANALLSRRLDQYQARHRSRSREKDAGEG